MGTSARDSLRTVGYRHYMVVLRFHVQASDRRDTWWSVDSPEVPTLYVSAVRLVDCQQLALAMLDAEQRSDADVRCVLADLQ